MNHPNLYDPYRVKPMAHTNVRTPQSRLRSVVVSSLVAVAVVTTIVLGPTVDASAAPKTDVSSAEDTEPPSTGPFVDIGGSPHQESILALWAAGITKGCAEWRYCPDEPVTRGEMAAFLARALELPTPEKNAFVDTRGTLFQEEAERLRAAGITNGCEPNRYCPDDKLTRGEMAAFLARALRMMPEYSDFSAEKIEGAEFKDSDGHQFEEDIAVLAAAGITRGCNQAGTEYCPDQALTRAEMATFLTRVLGLATPTKLDPIPEKVREEYKAETSKYVPTQKGAEGWRKLAERYFKPGDVDRAIKVIQCESGGDQYAANPHSSARGLFQHLGRFWKERSAKAGVPGADIFDPEAQMVVAAWLVYEQGGWRHWYPSKHCWGR